MPRDRRGEEFPEVAFIAGFECTGASPDSDSGPVLYRTFGSNWSCDMLEPPAVVKKEAVVFRDPKGQKR
jgi:hypothetical protein